MADVSLDIIQLVLKKFGLLKYSLEDFAASMFIRVNNPAVIGSLPFKIIGFLAGMAVAVLLGIAFIYLIDLSGFRFVKSKGVLYGFIIWFLIYGGIKTALHISYIQDYNAEHTMVQLFLHLLFGYCIGLFVVKIGFTTVTVK